MYVVYYGTMRKYALFNFYHINGETGEHLDIWGT